MPSQSLSNGPLIAQLSSLRSTEAQVLKALPKVVVAAASDKLRTLLARHLAETESHGVRLVAIAKLLDTKVPALRCEGTKHLIGVLETLLRESPTGSAKDVSIIGSVRRIEAFETDAYRRALSSVDGVSSESVSELLGQTLKEEETAYALLGALEGELKPGTLRVVDFEA